MSIIHNSGNWHRKEQDGVDENKNLPTRADTIAIIKYISIL